MAVVFGRRHLIPFHTLVPTHAPTHAPSRTLTVNDELLSDPEALRRILINGVDESVPVLRAVCFTPLRKLVKSRKLDIYIVNKPRFRSVAGSFQEFTRL